MAAEKLDALYDEGRAAWPGLSLDRAAFYAHVTACFPEGPPSAPPLHAADLFLACACLSGDAEAWRELDKRHLASIGDFVAAVDRSPAFAAEVRQRISEKLIGKDGKPGKLTTYSGRGPLGGWLRVASVREARDMKRAAPREAAAEIDAAADGPSPEIALLKRDLREILEQAFEEGIARLSTDERNVLRFHYLEGLSLEEIAESYGVSRATAGRWVQDARKATLAHVRRAVTDRIGSRKGEGAASLFALVESQLDLSVARLLGR